MKILSDIIFLVKFILSIILGIVCFFSLMFLSFLPKKYEWYIRDKWIIFRVKAKDIIENGLL